MDKQGLIERKLTDSWLDRRSFMVGVTALGLSAASASTMWSAQLLISNEGGIVVPAFADMMHAVSSSVGTSENIGGSWDLDGGHCVKRWWLNA